MNERIIHLYALHKLGETRVRIEVFIKKHEFVIQPTQLGRPIQGHYCTAHDTYTSDYFLTDASKKVLEEAILKAKETNAEIKVYDLSTFRGKIAAISKGVSRPTWRMVE